MDSPKLTLYMCDHTKNTECPKTSCKYNPYVYAKFRECTTTLKKEFAKLDENGEPIVAYATMLETAEHDKSGLTDE